MIDKIKNILTILLAVIIVFALIYSVINLIISATKKPTLITSENLSEYINQGQVVTNYSRYYFINDCLSNFITACQQNKYNELYNVYIADYKAQYSKDEVIEKLKTLQFSQPVFDIDIDFKYNLDTVYYTNNEYLLKIIINDETLYLIFRVDETGKEEYDYQFAFVK